MLRADNHFSRKSATAGASDSRGPTRFTQYEELAGSHPTAFAHALRSAVNTGSVREDRLSDRLIQVRDDVIHIFNSDRDANHAIGNTNRGPSLFAQCGVGHGGGV